MVNEKWPPLEPGTKVKTYKPNTDQRRQWTDEGWAKRRWGVMGVIIAHHDAHGLYYDVRHEDGWVAGYDPSEFDVVSEVTDIDKIGAGPELDALVAEKVMGWVGRKNELWTDKATGEVTKWGTDNCVTINDATTRFYFRPSTDIAAAWQVVEKIKATSSRGYVLDFLNGEWTAGLRACGDAGEPELYGPDAGSAEEAPLAICRAALKAVL